MINWPKYDMSKAKARYAISNSPIFLMDGLKANGEVKRLAKENRPELIVDALRDALDERQASLEASVRPYILAVAAILKGDPKLVAQVDALCRPVGGWLATITATARDSMPAPSFRVIPYKPSVQWITNRTTSSRISTTSTDLVKL